MVQIINLQIIFQKMMMDPHIVLNEQIQPKYQNYSSSVASKSDTLDEPVIDTIKRDIKEVYNKITITMRGEGNYQNIQKQWDLWGPLIISLITASMAAFGSTAKKDDKFNYAEEAFTNLFVGMWLGPLVITVNANLLGSNVPIMQTLCLIIYCSAPIMLLSIVIFLMNLLIESFLINLTLSIGALLFILRMNKGLFESFIPADRKLLGLYPVLLFYTFMCIFLAMT